MTQVNITPAWAAERPPGKMTTEQLDNDSFEATYAVKMHCNDCTDQIKQCLLGVPGIEKLNFDLQKQIMSVQGSVAPSSVVAALAQCGRDAIIRGTGQPNSSAVSVLETQSFAKGESPVRGLVRMVQVADNNTFFDITINGVASAGNYYASVREYGDVSQGSRSTGPVWHQFDTPIDCRRPSDLDGTLFSGSAFLRAPVNVWEMIGRSFVLSTQPSAGASSDLCGVIARSAGIWENDKQVCACSGKTVWEERKDALQSNIR
ncbi:hypothetical protein HG536_0G00860 [Torulaspora globosa]|uniref:Superoxide dismutase 1 copper chaperone n=1 Tax=Torulaspora globosa TaxID=48254 RepID=A0A7G3ZL43_9SACH|nr:uncharacterized protein HG536_0G00860 [Torulaspora globosa]QLL34229.1 hypothetical protein HG536_0G00860 [Torulaspora globosa]